MGMSVTMAAMMVPTAAPFFYAFGRDARRPAAVALLVLMYVAVWASIGTAVDRVVGPAMLPSSWLVAAAAIAFAAAYTVAPWSRWARARCREMCGRGIQSRRAGLNDAVRAGLRYTACCLVCSAGVMVAVIVVGMSNLLVVVLASALMLALKLTSWPQRALSSSR